MNCVALVGRTTRDMELRYTPSGAVIGECSIAVNSLRKRQGSWEEETSFFPVQIFGKTAENLEPYLKKGHQVALKGELRQQRWEYQGKRYQKVVINADVVELLQAPKQQTANPQPYRPPTPSPGIQQPRLPFQGNENIAYYNEEPLPEGPELFADDIPF